MAKSEDRFLVRASQDVSLDGEVWGLQQHLSEGGVKTYGIAGADGQAEAARKEAETARASAETKRAEDEAARVQAETARAAAEKERAQAESARVAAEKNRVSEEATRKSAEGGRVSAESARATAETRRADAEGSRASAESARASAESKRAQAEAARKEAETARVAAETQRNNAENTRIEAENARKHAETQREASENERELAQQKNNADQALNNEAMKKLAPIILQEGQFDPDTLAPTIEGEANRMYLVPMSKAVAATLGISERAVESGNSYAEWMWIGGKWELVGESTIRHKSISTDQIDSVFADEVPTGDETLNLTGLSYVWAKISAWAKGTFAAVAHAHAVGDVTGLQGALDGKQEKGSYAAAGHGHAASTQSAPGFMSADDKKKLDGIAAGANAYSLPTGNGGTKGGVKLSDSTTSTSNANGGVAATPAAVKAVKDSLDRVTRADVLYSGSTGSNFTLAKSAAGYKALIVQMSGPDGVVAESMPVISPNGKTVDLSNAFYAGAGYRYFRMRCAISGTSVNVVLNERFDANMGTMYHDLRITGVVGLAW